jgi:hypothetical protein
VDGKPLSNASVKNLKERWCAQQQWNAEYQEYERLHPGFIERSEKEIFQLECEIKGHTH